MTSPPGGRYAFDHLRVLPRPVQAHLPIMVGGSGERKTLRIVAQYADIWNAFGTPETLARKDEILREHCAAVGRDPATIERSVGCKITIRSTEAEAERARHSLLEHNRTPLAKRRGRPHLLDRDARADRRDHARVPGDRVRHVPRRAAGAVRRRDDGDPDQRGQADGRGAPAAMPESPGTDPGPAPPGRGSRPLRCRREHRSLRASRGARDSVGGSSDVAPRPSVGWRRHRKTDRRPGGRAATGGPPARRRRCRDRARDRPGPATGRRSHP